MPAPRRAPLGSWSVAGAIALMGLALVVTTWTTRSSVLDASDTLVRGQADALEQAVRADLIDLDGPPAAADLAQILADHAADGLRWVAVIDRDGTVLAEAGTASPGHVRVELRARGGRRGPGRARRGFRPQRLALELEPIQAAELREAATRTLGIGALAAATLLVIVVILVRGVLRREAEKREREREQRLASLGEMSAVLAHEIRNPLASLKGNAQLLAASLPEGDKPRRKAERVVDEALRLEQLTNDLLEYVRTGEIRRAPVDPAALVRGAAAAVDPDGDRITVDADGAPPRFALDEGRMRQVLINLLDNAIAAGPPVRASVRAAGDRLVVEVRDAGPGVAPDDLAHVFEPFFTKRTRGTGLGLAVARRVVEGHGGTIEASNQPGGGAIFRIELPPA